MAAVAPLRRTCEAMEEFGEERWQDCKATIGRGIGAEDAAWLEPLALREVQPHRVVLGGVPNSFFSRRITHRYQSLILEALRNAFPEAGLSAESALEVRLDSGPKAAPPTAGYGHPHRPAPSHGGPEYNGPWNSGQGQAAPLGSDDSSATAAGARREYTFANFVAAPANEAALAFAQQAAAAPGAAYNPLYLLGGSGLGKTHLMLALAHAVRRAAPSWEVYYRTGEEWRNEVLEAITKRRTVQLREQVRNADVLLVDDLSFLLISPRAQEELLHTVDALLRGGRQVVFSAPHLPRAMPDLIEPLASRMEMGLVVELSAPDLNTRIAVLQRRAAAAGVELQPASAELLARRITGDLRRLEGAVVRLAAFAQLHGHVITPEYAARTAAAFFDEPDDFVTGSANRVRPERVLDCVAERFGTPVRELKGRSRGAAQLTARRVAMHLLKVEAGCSYPEIGALLGGRSHSTIVHGHQTLREALETNEALRRTVAALRHLLRS